MFSRAIVRAPGPDAGRGLTTSGLGPPDIDLLFAQHAAYVAVLRRLGLEVEVLDPLPGFPDAYFVEDPAVMLPGAALITRPGAPARRGEAEAIAPALARRVPIVRLAPPDARGAGGTGAYVPPDARNAGGTGAYAPPATLDGGDVLEAGGRWFIGLSERTNEEGARALGRLIEARGAAWTAIPVGGGLHLKSSVNTLGGRALAITAALADHPAFAAYDRVVLDPGDEYAANALWINGTLLAPAGFPRARRKLAALGLPIVEMDVSEVRKMDGGLTCMSLRF